MFQLDFAIIVITSTSNYNDGASLIQSSLKEFPTWHLNKLAEVKIQPNLERNSKYNVASDHNFRIKFYDDEIREQAGIDAGGLMRGYISTLVESIQDQSSLFIEGKDGLKCPRIEETLSRKDTILNCTKNEEQVYSNLGMLLRCSYNTEDVTTGVYFSDILFNTAFNFDYSELQTPFAELTRDTHIRLARALVEDLPTDLDDTEKKI